MSRHVRVLSTALLALAIPAIALSQEESKLQLVQTIPLPGVQGRMDHMDVDAKGKRLFLSGLENGSVEVIDLKANKRTRSIPGFQKPQGIAYIAALNKLFVASGDDGMLRVFRGDTLALADSIPLERGANRVTYDTRAHLLYVGYGGKDAGKDYGEVGIIDVRADKQIADIRVAAHPAEILLDRSGRTLYVFVSALNEIQVVDIPSRRVTATWPVSSKGPGDGAFDEGRQRLFLGTHNPPEMIALDAKTGKEVASLPAPEGMDGVYFDAKLSRIYLSGGRAAGSGFVFVYQLIDADHYEVAAKIATRPGAGTSFWSPELNRYYVAAPAHDGIDAALLVYEPKP